MKHYSESRGTEIPVQERIPLGQARGISAWRQVCCAAVPTASPGANPALLLPFPFPPVPSTLGMYG